MYPLGTGPQIPMNLNPMYENPPFLRKFRQKKHHKNGLPKGFQPVPIHTFPKYNDSMLLPGDYNCSIIQVFEEKVKNSSYLENLTERFKNVSLEVGRLINLTTEETESLTIYDVCKIYDVFICDVYDDKPLPQNISDNLWKNLTLLSHIYKIYKISADLQMLQFYVTPFFQEIILSFESKINGSSGDLKWKMYSAHDTSLAVFMTALNLTSYQCIDAQISNGSNESINCFPSPEFAANLIIELHHGKKSGQYVKVRYNGQYVYLCETKKKKCSWNEFLGRLKNFMVDYDTICNSENAPYSFVRSLKTRSHLRARRP